MQQAVQDRRNNKAFSFPLIDCEGHKVAYERRSGKERRKKSRDSDVAWDIIHILNVN